MSTITINITAPELAQAINALAEALSGNAVSMPISTQSPMPAPAATPVATAPVAMPAGIPAPVAAPAAAQAPMPVSQQPVPAFAPVAPTAAPPSYTLEMLQGAAAELVREGKQADLLALLGKYNLASMQDMQPTSFGTFATDLRMIGAKI